jgi:hypothetical protein
VVGLVVLLPSTTWCIPHLLDNCADLNNCNIWAITRNTNSGSSSCNNSNNSSSSTVLLLQRCNRLQSGHCSSLPLATFRASTVGRWGTLLANAARPRKAICNELRDLLLISKGANRGPLHHGLAAPTTPPWMRSPWEKKC